MTKIRFKRRSAEVIKTKRNRLSSCLVFFIASNLITPAFAEDESLERFNTWYIEEQHRHVTRTITDPLHLSNEIAMEWLPSMFFGVAISGGGSRAANFGAAGLQYLDELGLLDHVTAISSVSGGSLPAAYYGYVSGQHERWKDWQSLKDKLTGNFVGNKWMLLLKSIVLDNNKSLEIAKEFNKQLFHGATFESLGKPGPRKPLIFLNTTMFGSDRRFVFDSDQYDYGLLPGATPMAHLPLSTAVAASSAYPGLMDAIAIPRGRTPDAPPPTLYNRIYDGSRWRAPTGREKAMINKAIVDELDPQTFIHLYDGGAADNLGLEQLIISAQNYYVNSIRRNGKRMSGCFFVVINAGRDSKRDPENIKRGEESDLRRNIWERVISPTAWDAIDTTIDSRSLDLLERIGFPYGRLPVRWNTKLSMGLPSSSFLRIEIDPEIAPNRSVAVVGEEILAFPRISKFKLFESLADREFLKERVTTITDEDNSFTCTAWLIQNQHLPSLFYHRDEKGNFIESFREKELVTVTDALQYRYLLATFFEQIPTDWSLRGPPGCKPKFIQDRLYDIVAILMLEDENVLNTFCSNFAIALGKEVLQKCKPKSTPSMFRKRLEWRFEGAKAAFCEG